MSLIKYILILDPMSTMPFSFLNTPQKIHGIELWTTDEEYVNFQKKLGHWIQELSDLVKIDDYHPTVWVTNVQKHFF